MSGVASVRSRHVQLALLARAVLGCPGVSQLHAGPTGRIISATVTGRVIGLLFDATGLTVGVIAGPSTEAEQVRAHVRAAVRPMIPSGTSVTVVVSSPRLGTANF